MRLGSRQLLVGLLGLAGLTAAKEHPISKIVKMLRDMQTQLEKDGENDAAVYKKLTCWCTDGKKEKEKAIETGRMNLDKLEKEHKGAEQAIVKLNEAQKNIRVESRKHREALAKATEQRSQARKEFAEMEAETLETISAVKSALVILGKHNPQFTQLKAVAGVIKRSAEQHATKAGMREVKSFFDDLEKNSFLQQPDINYGSYASQSGQIFGVLQNMQENTEKDLGEAKTQDEQDEKDFQDLRAAKEDQIAALEKQLNNAKQEYARQKEINGSAFEELEQTKAQLKLDEAFLAKMVKQCESFDKEYKQRTKGRAEEIAAVGETIQILNADDSFDSFSKSLNFLQVGSKAKKQRQLMKVLSKLDGSKPKVQLLQAYAKLDSFTKVKAAVQKMIDELKVQQQTEVKERDLCVKRKNDLDLEMQQTVMKKDKLEADLKVLGEKEKSLTQTIKELTQENAELKDEMQRASEDRSAGFQEFNVAVADQRVTIQILNKALERMQQKYASFLQQQPGAAHMALGGAPPAKFKEYNASSGGNKVINMLQSVLKDAKTQEQTLVADESDDQSFYAKFIKDSNRDYAHREKMINTQTQQLAKTKSDISDKTEARGHTLEAVKALMGEDKAYHADCDFLLNNFETRQDARITEMNALKQAKDILSGMN